MHRLFEVADLVLEILEILALNEQLHFGLTCKGIWILALPHVWERTNTDAIHTLIHQGVAEHDCTNVTKCRCHFAPNKDLETTAEHHGHSWEADFFNRGEISIKKNTYVFPPKTWHDIAALKWARMTHYGAFVRHLHLSDALNFYVKRPSPAEDPWLNRLQASGNAVCELAAYPGLASLFPKLRSLSLKLSYQSSVRASAAFAALCPSLSIHIDCGLSGYDPDAMGALLARVGVRGHPLEHFRLRALASDTDISGVDSAIRRIITCSPNIRALSLVVTLRDHDLVHLVARLPRLEALQFKLGRSERCTVRGEQRSLLISKMGHSPFPTLRSLVIMGNSLPKHCKELLQAIASPDFAELRLPFCKQGEATAILEIVARKWPATLTRIVVSLDGDDILLAILQPLTACRELKRITVEGRGVYLTEEELDEMGAALPHLKSVNLSRHSFTRFHRQTAFRRLERRSNSSTGRESDTETAFGSSGLLDMWGYDDWRCDDWDGRVGSGPLMH